ncbi:MAG: glycogen debranching protein, partial [Planctomycetes bacterium]|nr:glycogen debranching protein [Planctomycetota bacterium]
MNPITEERLLDPRLEWLEADGLGGFAMGTVSGIRTRRYHGLLCAARTPPTGRVMLVNAVEAWVDLGAGPRALSSHRYLPAVTHPDGAGRLVSFTTEPFPSWTYELEDGVRIVHELFVPRDRAEVVLVWRLVGAPAQARITLRPLLSLRDVHALRRESAGLALDSHVAGSVVSWQPDAALPAVNARSNALYHAEPVWFRDFLYEEERARGYDHVEDLVSPGFFQHDLGNGDACLVLAAGAEGPYSAAQPVGELVHELRARELARRAALAPLERSAEAYLVLRGKGRSIIAGYPWFADWGRDTFLAL